MISTLQTHDSKWEMSKIGSVILLQAMEGEFFAVLVVCCSQAGSSAVIATWTIDGEATCQQLTGAWNALWEAFLDVLPESIQPEVAHSEMTVKI